MSSIQSRGGKDAPFGGEEEVLSRSAEEESFRSGFDTYPNCLVRDDGLIMPAYGIAALDSVATRVYRRVSGRTVHHMRGGAILGFGSSGPHCLTLEFRE